MATSLPPSEVVDQEDSKAQSNRPPPNRRRDKPQLSCTLCRIRKYEHTQIKTGSLRALLTGLEIDGNVIENNHVKPACVGVSPSLAPTSLQNLRNA